jgi:hypothetical protein
MSEKPPVVAVSWEDASAMDDGAWVANKDHEYTPKMFISVGFLLYDGADGITLTSAWSEDMVAARDKIPRKMVHSITYLEPSKAKRARK